jgi:hypothetical protein
MHACLSLLWLFVAVCRSAAEDVELSGCTLELPPPEFERLAVLARTGGGQVVLRLSGEQGRRVAGVAASAAGGPQFTSRAVAGGSGKARQSAWQVRLVV